MSLIEKLPVKGYQDNPTAIALMTPIVEFLAQITAKLEDFYLEVDPDTAAVSSLDYLGFLVGFHGQWDTDWTAAVKRELIRQSLKFLWPNRGTLRAIAKVLDIHSIPHLIWYRGLLTLPFNLTGTFGGEPLEYFIRLPHTLPRLGAGWLEAVRTVLWYSPAPVRGVVCHDYFALGVDLVGDPLFDVPA